VKTRLSLRFSTYFQGLLTVVKTIGDFSIFHKRIKRVYMKGRFFTVLLAGLVTNAFLPAASAQKDQTGTVEDSISAIIKKLTLEEKVAMVHANGLFSSSGVKRLGIPDLVCDDGPLGVREDVLPHWRPANLTTDSATFFPNGSALAATWNPDLAFRYGHDLGEEARARGKQIILAPAFNITRTPLNGRTYEYLSEDPFLNARLAVYSVKGIQGQGVAACIKHFAVNNQEVDRGRINVQIDERSFREIFLPAFKAAVTEADAWTLMAAYNKIRGTYCSENDYLLNTILRKEWGFRGLVVSDWGGTHSTVDAANHGLDLEMGSGENYDKNFFADSLLSAIKEGKVSEATLDEKVRRILQVMFKTSLDKNAPAGSLNTAAHSKTAYDIAAESIVLLKNDKGMLPLALGGVKSVAVIGDNAVHQFHSGGFGAGVKARYEVTALEGLKDKLPASVHVAFAQGYSGVYRAAGFNVNTDTKGSDPKLVAEAAALARQSDLTILFIGGNRDYESESRDRKDLSLPFGEQVLVDSVLTANPRTIVVVVGGAPYDIAGIQQKHHTIVWSWYNGSENGNALADVLLGKVNPSGKLPFTFPMTLADAPAHANGPEAYPGVNLEETYKEGILVGYRWYDTKKIQPLYPFGYGLSYSSFSLADLRINKTSFKKGETAYVKLKITNKGRYAGKETVQVYVAKAGSAVDRAEKELKGFQKLPVPGGGSAEVSIAVKIDDLAYFDAKSGNWVVEPGTYKIMAGTSSRDIKLTQDITVTAE
jgi:beta-glucosidase